MANIKVTFPDGSVESVAAGTKAQELLAKLPQKVRKEVVAAIVNDQVMDLSSPLTQDTTLNFVTFEDNEGKEVFWHSGAHLLGQAITRLYPGAKLTIGPVVDDGFYYDFHYEGTISPDDFPKIEAEMKKIVEEKLDVSREALDHKKAKELFKDNKFKLELIEEYKDDQLTLYRQGDFYDLCRGPHVPNTGMLKHLTLTKASGAYWRGDANKEQLQRIYGVVFPKKEQLEAYIHQKEEAAKRDHKLIGERMELFSHFDMIGKGLPVWLPKGEIIKEAVEQLAKETEKKYGYVRVATPHLAKQELFETSGHLPYYKDDMYPGMQLDDGMYYMKAMNCPLHHLIFNKKPRSYRELPLRIAEYGMVYRNEMSGTLNGLLRVRGMRQNDAHLYCRKDQIEQEVKATLQMIKEYFDLFALTDYWFRLSLGDMNNKKKYIHEPENWSYAEDVLRRVLQELKLPFVEVADEAAFYGPKIDVQFKNVHGREETMSTVQLDFVAKTRFNLNYIDDSGEKNNEVFVIHRAPLSTHERFMAFLIEHYAGKFPVWLAPVQVKVLTLNDEVNDYSHDLVQALETSEIRVETDDRSESMNYKIRQAQLENVPLIVVIGPKEQENNTVAIRTLDGKQKFGISKDKFVETVIKSHQERWQDTGLDKF